MHRTVRLHCRDCIIHLAGASLSLEGFEEANNYIGEPHTAVNPRSHGESPAFKDLPLTPPMR